MKYNSNPVNNMIFFVDLFWQDIKCCELIKVQDIKCNFSKDKGKEKERNDETIRGLM